MSGKPGSTGRKPMGLFQLARLVRTFLAPLGSALIAATVVISCGGDDPFSPPPPQQTPMTSRGGGPQAQARPQVVADQYIVTFRDGANVPPGLVNALSAQHGLQVRHNFANVFKGFSAVIPSARLAALRNHPMIESIEPVGIFYLQVPVASQGPVVAPPTGLRLRLLADQLALSDGATVSSWPNFGGSEGPATQGTSNKRPTFHAAGATGAFGGHAHVGFSDGGGPADLLEVTGVGSHGSATLVAVFSQTDKAAHNYGLLAVYGTSNSRGTFATMFNTGADPLGYWDFTLGTNHSTFSPTVGGEHVAVWRIDGSNVIDFQVDGVSHGSIPTNKNMVSFFNRYIVGAPVPTGANPFDGQLAELMLYDRPLSDCERDQLVGDLGAEYAINVNGVGVASCGPPTAPSGLAASTVDHESVDLSWTDQSTNEDGFTVERRLGQTGAFQVVTQTGPDVVAFTDAGLTGDTEYCYRVAAFNANGASTYATVQCATTSTAPPPPPPPSPPITVPGQGLRVRLVANQLTLTDGAAVDAWPNLGGSEGNATQGSSTKRPSFHQAGSSKFAGRAYVGFNETDTDEYLDVTGVSSHGSATLVAVFSQTDKAAHNFGLMAVYGSSNSRGTFATMFTGNGDPLGYWDVTLGTNHSTFSPTAGGEHVAVWRIDGSNALDFQVDGVSHGSTSINNNMVSFFNRYIIGAPGFSGTNPFDGQVAELIMYDRALSNCEQNQLVGDLGAEYGINVNGAGSGSCNPPAAPTGLAASTVDHESVDLVWTDGSADEDGFTVERRLGQTGTFQVVTQTGPDVTAHTDAGLAGDTEYCYRVAAFNINGASTYATVQCATTAIVPPPPPPPNAPINVPSQGLRVRLVANQLGLIDGAAVDTWPNLGGSEGDATQGTGAKRPTFHQAGSSRFAGRAYVAFNEVGTDDYLDVTGVSAHASATLVAVFSQTDKAAHNYGLLAVYGSSNSRGTFATMFTGSGDPLGYWDPTLGTNHSTFSPTAGAEHVAVWRIDGSNVVDFQVDGVSQGSLPTTKNMVSFFNRYIVGAPGFSGTNAFDGQLAELIMYDRALSNCEQNQVVGDLGAEYAINVNGAGSGSCNAPSAPTNLTATTVDSWTIDLGWTDGSTDEDGFTVERRLGQTGAFQVVTQTGPDVAVYTDAGLTADTEFCYRVATFNANGTSTYTTVECAITSAAPPAPPPIAVPGPGLRLRLVASELSLGDGASVAAWPNLGGSEGDAVQGSATKQPVFHPTGATGKFGNQAHVGFNESDSDEYLEVTGVSAHGSATLVAVFSQTDKAAHNYGLMAIYDNTNNRGTFATMFNTGVDPLGYWDVTLGTNHSTFSPTAAGDHVAVWRIAGSDVIDFQIDGVPYGSSPIATDMHAAFSRYLIGAPEPTGANQFDGQLAELVLYDRALLDCERDELVGDLGARYAVNVNGVGGTPCDPPTAPSGLTASAPDYQSIDVTWIDGSINEDGFRLERRQGQVGPFQLVVEVGPNVTSYNDVAVVPSTEYCYQVSAFNVDGVALAPNIACETPPAPPPGVCFDTGNHDNLAQQYNMQLIEVDQNRHWQANQVPGCEMTTWMFFLDSGVDSNHPDLNVADVQNFVMAEPSHTGEDGNGHGTHVAGIAAAIDGNGGVVGVAPGAPVHAYRVCADDGTCQIDDILAAMDAIAALKMANPNQPMVVNVSLAGSASPPVDTSVRTSTNLGIFYSVGAGNGIIGACFFPADAQTVSPAGVGDDDINAQNGSNGNTARLNGVLTVTLSDEFDQDGDCNFGNPVTIAAPGANIFSTWMGGSYNTITGTSMSSPHGAGAAALYLQEFPMANPVDVEAWIMGQLDPWTTDDLPNADGRLNVRSPNLVP